ncbi:MAG: SAM-dependent methyltransferase [Flavobacteriales bacterium]|nr:SAM-dependent methyltransferase [Flavobacteriales bacterium]
MIKLSSSFRDPSGYVFKKDDFVYRHISKSGIENYDRFMQNGLYEQLAKKKYLVRHEETERNGTTAVIKPEQISFISYPYEWSFSMLKDAALLTLNIQKESIQKGMSLKDASAYNVQFANGIPIFIDTLSFEPYQEGKPWVGYKQFCQHFLAPLALASYVDIRCLQLLKNYIDGIPLDLASKLLPVKTKFKFSLATHIHLHAKSQLKYADKQTNQHKGRGVSKMAMLGLIDNLANGIKSLQWKPKGTEWGEYYTFTNYTDNSFDAKKQLVEKYIDQTNAKSLWDMGANDGTFSRIAADKAIATIAFDIDPIAVEKNYMQGKKTKKPMLPLLQDLTNPSPALGWANIERDNLATRGMADVVMALALIHHIAISNNVSLEMVAKYFSTLGHFLIIEFVPKQDSQVQKLLATRTDIFEHYHETGFENSFNNYFEILEKNKVGDSHRTLYLMRKKHV